MFLTVWDWLLPISVGLFAGVLISTRKRVDLTQLVTLDPEEFRLNMRKGQLVDIRKEEDYKKSKVNGSRNFPKRSIFSQIHKMRKDQAVFIIGSVKGINPKSVAKKLIKKGFRPVYILRGGIENWPFILKEE